MAGLYIHIPFCESRCIYCGFYSTTSLALRERYVEALCQEADMRPAAIETGGNEPISTVYLGGGTPSQLDSKHLERLFDAIGKVYAPFSSSAEVTMECNPDDVTSEFCIALSHLPINRISMGAQTFSDERLRFLHRRHNAGEVRDAVARLRKIGIGNISIDLMFGFPGESIEDWQRDIEEAIALGVEHISAYSLMVEEGTPLHRMTERGEIKETDEELSRLMYETLIDRLTAAGYEHYEISNFAKPGFRSRHNSSYWHEVPYIGLGAAAHSYNREERSWNVADIRQYIESISRGTRPCEREELDLRTRYNDLITTALRTSDGIATEEVRKRYGKEIYEYFMREADKHMGLGLMKIREGHLSLTRQGLFISDDIMSDFMMV